MLQREQSHHTITGGKKVFGKSQTIYLLGVIVVDFSKVEEDMITVEVPEAEYAVFTTTPVDTTKDKEQKEFAEIIAGTWKYIFEDWFKESGYIYNR